LRGGNGGVIELDLHRLDSLHFSLRSEKMKLSHKFMRDDHFSTM
jgi:hypothetical protein